VPVASCVQDYTLIRSLPKLQVVLKWTVRHHGFLSLCCYLGGFVGFVVTLQKGKYLEQFAQLAWTNTILLYTLVPSSFLVSLIFQQGILWLVFPACLVIVNDVAAYFFGFFFGRTPLIKISPKKTWEGWVGGLIGTILVALILSSKVQTIQWLACPRRDLTIFSWVTCDTHDMYQNHTYALSDFLHPSLWENPAATGLRTILQDRAPGCLAWLEGLCRVTFSLTPFQLHSVVLAFFAAAIAPFGGFFASGFKRALNVKDFGDSIPGHGGMTDRMDCQLVMGVFSYVYLHHFMLGHTQGVEDLFERFVMLDHGEQLEVFEKVKGYLIQQGQTVIAAR